MQTVFFGIGCFWGGQKYFDQIKGVVNTEVGYLNGGASGVSYEEVCNSSGHAEVVKVTFNEKISHQELFEAFIRVVDPYTLNQQKADKGVQYRSGIYFTTKEQEKDFKSLLAHWESKNSKSMIEILQADDYTIAEENHQKYLEKNPGGYCHINLNDVPRYLRK